jgi:hypothetical protein
MRRSPLVLAFVAVAAALTLAASAAEEKWAAEIKEGNAAYSTARLAILKIDDAAYVKPGARAWLVRTGEANGKLAWSYTPKKGALLEVGVGADGVAEARKNGAAIEGSLISLTPDVDVRIQPTQVSAGVMGVRAFAFNQANPAAKAFAGLSYFPYDPAYKVDAVFAPAKPEAVDFETSRGITKRFYRVGAARFTLKGQALTLPLYSEFAQGGEKSAFFLDANSGKATYAAGRYVDVEAGASPEALIIDFNYAFNPNCARSPFYTCPLTKDRLAIAVDAGEKAPPGH